MGTLTVERLDNLYWLGRYVERVYQSISLYSNGFDIMLDGDPDAYKEICRTMGMPDTYESAEDFNRSIGFDVDNPFSLISNLYRAYDNAMVMRDEISTDTLAYIHLAITEVLKAKDSDAPVYELMKVKDNILAFWGSLDDYIDNAATRNTVKAGKRVERLDIFLRLKKDQKDLIREVDRLTSRIETTDLMYNAEKLAQIRGIVSRDEVDYLKALNLVWTLLE